MIDPIEETERALEFAEEEIARLRRERDTAREKCGKIVSLWGKTKIRLATANGLLDEMEASLTTAPHKDSDMAAIGYRRLVAWQRTILAKRKGAE